MENRERLGVTDKEELKTILRITDYGRKGTGVWKLINETGWKSIRAKGKQIIAAMRKAVDQKL